MGLPLSGMLCANSGKTFSDVFVDLRVVVELVLFLDVSTAQQELPQ